MKLLEGKSAVVTGAASGIGRATAIRFGRDGAKVVVSDIDADGLAGTKAALEAEGAAVESVVSSVEDAASTEALVARALSVHGGLDVFFANAGVSGGLRPFLELSAEELMGLFRVNVLGPFLGIKHAALHMQESGGGSIVCTASVAGLRAGAGSAHYSASKAAVISLVQLAAVQLAGTGVRVNAICPGLIETGMTRPLFEYARAVGKESKIGQLAALRRAGQPEEIAAVAAFLASDESSYVTGQAWVVDGGLSASLPFIPGKMA
jgi:NAD(P)-dependent dehydrogenase (short-subunit alcohol dehydrogenase family)